MTSVTDLENDLRRYNDAYTRGSTLISDDHYDRLVIELSELTKNTSPVLSEIDSTIWYKRRRATVLGWILDKVIGKARSLRMAKNVANLNKSLQLGDKLGRYILSGYVRDGSTHL
jgi:hypothetical protein